jgi:hypothetical protein
MSERAGSIASADAPSGSWSDRAVPIGVARAGQPASVDAMSSRIRPAPIGPIPSIQMSSSTQCWRPSATAGTDSRYAIENVAKLARPHPTRSGEGGEALGGERESAGAGEVVALTPRDADALEGGELA